jgi:hypothetical protein
LRRSSSGSASSGLDMGRGGPGIVVGWFVMAANVVG